MAMDREEKLGLGAAVGGHAVLVLALALGLFMATDPIVKPPPLTVTLVDEAQVTAAPEPVQDEPAPAAAAGAEMAEEIDAPEPDAVTVAEPEPQPQPLPKPVAKPVPMAKPMPKPALKPTPKPIAKPTPKPVAKPATKPSPAKVAKPSTPTRPTTTPVSRPVRGHAGLGAAVNAVSKTGKTGSGTATKTGTPAVMTSAQVSSAVNVSLRAEIEPLFRRCAPSGPDVSDITTFVTLRIGKDKRLIDVDVTGQPGISEINRRQAPLLEKCVINAARAASPFQSLPDEGYDQWSNWQMKFKTR